MKESGARTDDPTDDGLPLAVAEMRQDIYYATRRDWDALRALLDPKTFSYSFGESGDPIGYWRGLEEEDHLPVVGLRLAVGGCEASAGLDGSGHRGNARRGYRDRDIRAFQEQVGGYAGWRAGIRPNGTWLYFISGD